METRSTVVCPVIEKHGMGFIEFADCTRLPTEHRLRIEGNNADLDGGQAQRALAA